ncbi:MAG: hypothetical protein JO291_03570 [Acidimicrobiia bacterium]|nr:hypothetical protein [Acidimicrobiia bacterium]
MARLHFRDRFFTPKVARAVTSPSAILATGAFAAVGALAFGPIGLLAGLVGYAGRVALAVPRNERGPNIDPFAVKEPWRSFVGDAVKGRRRYDEAIEDMPAGPLKERLVEIGGRLDTGLVEVWNIAKRGQVIADARRHLNPDEARWEMAQLAPPGTTIAPGSTNEQTMASLQAQVAAADRMDRVIRDTIDRLRLLDARFDETVTRAVELSVDAPSGGTGVGGLGDDVDGMVTEMEALRQALDETDQASPGT